MAPVLDPQSLLHPCLRAARPVVGLTTLVRMPVDMFPNMDLTVVVIATFYPGMPPEQVENDITQRQERFFTLAPGIEHIESRSLPGASIIKIFFQPGTNPDSAVSTISNLAAAEQRRLPPGTLPPIVLKFDASALPVCLIALKGEGMTEATLRDIGALQGPHAGGESAGGGRAPALRRQVPADHDLCRPATPRRPSPQPHGRRARGE